MRYRSSTPNAFGINYTIVEGFAEGMFGAHLAPIMELHTVPGEHAFPCLLFLGPALPCVIFV
jgi:hypothetical protein